MAMIPGELDCGGVHDQSVSITLYAKDLAEFRQKAAQYGWSYDPETDEDFCRECTKLRNEGN